MFVKIIKSLFVLIVLLSMMAFSIHHIKKCIKKHKDSALSVKRSVFTILLTVIMCFSWYLFGSYTYPFNRKLDPVLVAQFDVTGKYVLDRPGNRFWRGAFHYELFGIDIESFWFNPEATTHLEAEMPALDYENHCYVITYGQKIDTLSYNCWDIIPGTWAKAGQITFQDEFYPSTVFIYELPRIMIENDINHKLTRGD